jgi:hypothetical protein
MNDTDSGHIGWPYTERSCLIAPDTARSIRAWALKEMTEAQLNAPSQRQLMEMHLKRARDILAKVRPQMNDPEVKAWSQAKAEEKKPCTVGRPGAQGSVGAPRGLLAGPASMLAV